MENQTEEQVLEEEDGTPQGEATTTEAEETTTQNTGLTEAQIRAIMREERELTAKQMAEETAKAFRAMQSMSDKKAAQIKKAAEQQVALMEQSGAQITPEMRTNYVNMLVNDYRDSLNDEAPEAAQPQTPKESGNSQLFDSAKVAINRTAKKLGVKIDPEVNTQLDVLWKNVNSWEKYEEFLDKADALLNEKAQAGKTPPQARMANLPGQGGGTFTPTKEALAAELEKLLEHPHPKNLKRIEELQEKLKQ